MKVSLNRNHVLVEVVFGLLSLSIALCLVGYFRDQKNPVQTVSRPGVTTTTAPGYSTPYYVSISLDKLFTQEVRVYPNTSNTISTRVNGVDYVMEFETHPITDRRIAVTLRTMQTVKTTDASSQSQFGFSEELTLDAPPTTYPRQQSVSPRHPRHTLMVSVHSQPTMPASSHR